MINFLLRKQQSGQLEEENCHEQTESSWIILLMARILTVLAATPTYAVEAHFYAATHGLSNRST